VGRARAVQTGASYAELRDVQALDFVQEVQMSDQLLIQVFGMRDMNLREMAVVSPVKSTAESAESASSVESASMATTAVSTSTIPAIVSAKGKILCWDLEG